MTNESTTTYKTEALPSPAELEVLDKILPHVKHMASGVAGKETIQLSGVNVQIVNGEGKTATANGEGNLVIGYDENKENKHEQTGSHNLILGEEQTFTSYAGIVAGASNTINSPFASVTGGFLNTASSLWASVSGGNRRQQQHGLRRRILDRRGHKNQPSGRASSIFGGNEASAAGEYEACGGYPTKTC